jgi:preprotein translocase subunit SecD
LRVFLCSERDAREARQHNRRMDDLAAVEAAIYDQSFRALDEQSRVLDALRARAGALVAGANVTTAFLGGLAEAMQPDTHIRLDRSSWTAVALFAAAHPHRMIDTYLDSEAPASLRHFRRAITYYNGRNVDANARQLQWMFRTAFSC